MKTPNTIKYNGAIYVKASGYKAGPASARAACPKGTYRNDKTGKCEKLTPRLAAMIAKAERSTEITKMTAKQRYQAGERYDNYKAHAKASEAHQTAFRNLTKAGFSTLAKGHYKKFQQHANKSYSNNPGKR